MWRELLGLDKKPQSLLDLLTPRRSFADVILPEETRRQLYEALTQIEKHRLIFTQWGLGERHPTGLGLVFNFAGPPGTGKTICAEAIATALGRKLLRVRYAELESCWAGETGKNIRNVFREARTHDAVLFFDEADSVASRRFSNVQIGYEREANQAVNILLKEVEEHEGVVIFATNMASSFDPAFERRIRTHVLFRLPDPSDRARIWQAQLHPSRTPLAPDVDFEALAERFAVSGGDIRNAVLKAAQMAAAEEGPDEAKRLHQRHFLSAMEEVLAAREVMRQNSVDSGDQYGPLAREALREAAEVAQRRLDRLHEELDDVRLALASFGEELSGITARVSTMEATARVTGEQLAHLDRALTADRQARLELEETLSRRLAEAEGRTTALAVSVETMESAVAQVRATLESRVQALETALRGATVLPLPVRSARWLAGGVVLLLLLLGASGGYLVHLAMVRP